MIGNKQHMKKSTKQKPQIEEDKTDAAAREKRDPHSHRTVDRVTQILEEVVYRPGMTFAELVRALGAAKSSVHGFIQGLLVRGWLYEEQNRFYLGPAVHSLALVSGHIRAGSVTHNDLVALHEATGLVVFLGVQAGDHLIYIAEAGSDSIDGFEVRSNIRRTLLNTASGKALLAARPDAELKNFLRRCGPDEQDQVQKFLDELKGIKTSRIATNLRQNGKRFAIATTVRNSAGEAVAAVTLVGLASEMQPRTKKLSTVLLKYADAWAQRSLKAREAI